MFSRFQRDSELLMENVISLIYFMRGAVSFEEMMCQVTPGIRQQMSDFIDKRLDAERKKMFAIY